jgi:hypothetical protein
MKIELFHALLDVGFDAYETTKGIKIMLNRNISKQEVFTALNGMIDYSAIQRIDKNTLFIQFEEEVVEMLEE